MLKKTSAVFFSALFSILSIAQGHGEECSPRDSHKLYQDRNFYEERSLDCCDPCAPVCGGLVVSGDLLYWRASMDGLSHCHTDSLQTITVGDTTIRSFSGRSDDLNYRWSPGFRIGVGYEFGGPCATVCDKWDLTASWTHFHTHTSDNHASIPSLLKWTLDYDTLDIIAGRDFDCLTCFNLRPFGGLRFARIDGSLRSANVEIGTPNSFIRRDKSRFLGAGPQVGLEASWDIGCGFSVYANGAVSALFGQFRNRLQGADFEPGFIDVYSTRQRQYSCTTVLDAGLGVRWDTQLCDKYDLEFKLGLELHKYYNFNRTVSNCGDLCLEGGTFSAGLRF